MLVTPIFCYPHPPPMLASALADVDSCFDMKVHLKASENPTNHRHKSSPKWHKTDGQQASVFVSRFKSELSVEFSCSLSHYLFSSPSSLPSTCLLAAADFTHLTASLAGRILWRAVCQCCQILWCASATILCNYLFIPLGCNIWGIT